MNLKNKISCTIGIVGGGSACENFLNLLDTKSIPYLDIKISGVCDINPEARGLARAKRLGIATFHNITDFFKDNNYDAVIELTQNKSLPELITIRPDNVGILEHNITQFIRELIELSKPHLQTGNHTILDKRYYEILFQQTNLGVVVIDPDFNIVDANDVYLNAVKKIKKDVISKKCYEVVKGYYAPCPSKSPDIDCPMIKTLHTGEPLHMIHDNVLPDGKVNYFSISAYPIRDVDGKVSHVIELWQDITSEITEKWENKVNRIHADMKKVIQEDRLVSLGKLAASSVHEINNPIQGLLTFSYIIDDMAQKKSLDDKDMKQLREFNTHMMRELERCGDIVSGLLAFSRESEPALANTEMNDILKTVISFTRHKIKLSGIQLDTSLSNVPLFVYGDKNQLQQCLLNLIFNAIDSISKPGTIKISSGLNETEKKVWIEVSDTGCGISNKNLEHIYDPFFTTKEKNGTGLGLSIVYGIIKDHKGDIQTKSILNKGTSFIISLPYTISV